MKKLVIWYNRNKKVYYYRYIYDLFDRYYAGYVNQYNHVVVLTIDVYKELIRKVPFRNKVIKRFISFLHRLEKY